MFEFYLPFTDKFEINKQSFAKFSQLEDNFLISSSKFKIWVIFVLISNIASHPVEDLYLGSNVSSVLNFEFAFHTFGKFEFTHYSLYIVLAYSCVLLQTHFFLFLDKDFKKIELLIQFGKVRAVQSYIL